MAAAVAAAALLGIPVTAAQPISLTPPAAIGAAPMPAQNPNDGNQIQVAPLQPVDASWSGPLSQAKGGLPRDMWNGTSRRFVAATLPQLQPVVSPELDSLARRLLLSDAIAPVAPPATGTANAPAGSALLSARIDRIYALGFVADGLALIDSLPADAATEAIDRDRVELRFAANDGAGACRDVSDRIAHYAGPWWARALIACQALAGDFAEASLGQSLLIDQRAPPDPEFDALIRALSERRPIRIARLGDPTPLRLALLAAAKHPLPVEALAVADPAALAGYAGNQAVPPDGRLAAAERAEALGALPPEALAALYGTITLKPEELARARRATRPPTDAHERALLYALATSGTDLAARMIAIEALMADAERRSVFVPMARVVAPILADIPSVNADPKFAAMAARILLAAGSTAAAQPWVIASQDKAVLLLSRVALPGVPQIDAGLARNAAAAAGNAAASPRADLLYSLLVALGDDPATLDDLTPSALTAPLVPGALPNAALWDAQQRAAQNGRLGETVLATLLLAASGGHLTPEPLLLGRAVSGLRAVGLDSDAHALALEAAIDAGI
ncbi:MAG: hypothetical protein KGL11_13645 [Alphaproteobacteria bacterium]|nr:hypothetical protein [Alphaproteobacteria bacterium]